MEVCRSPHLVFLPSKKARKSTVAPLPLPPFQSFRHLPLKKTSPRHHQALLPSWTP